MDSPLTHLDPSALERRAGGEGPLRPDLGRGEHERDPGGDAAGAAARPRRRSTGRVLSGYDANLGAEETAASVFGSRDPWPTGCTAPGARGTTTAPARATSVPGDFLSREMRGKLGYRAGARLLARPRRRLPGRRTTWTIPGRLLDATYFRARNLSAELAPGAPSGVCSASVRRWHTSTTSTTRWTTTRSRRRCRWRAACRPSRWTSTWPSEVAVQRRAAGRDAGAGGRLGARGRAATSTAPTATRVRTIARRDNGMLMFQDLMWPDADDHRRRRLPRADAPAGQRATLSATVRLDGVSGGRRHRQRLLPGERLTRPRRHGDQLSGAAVASCARRRTGRSRGARLGGAHRGRQRALRRPDARPARRRRARSSWATRRSRRSAARRRDLWVEGGYARLSLSAQRLRAAHRRLHHPRADRPPEAAPAQPHHRLPLRERPARTSGGRRAAPRTPSRSRSRSALGAS